MEHDCKDSVIDTCWNVVMLSERYCHGALFVDIW